MTKITSRQRRAAVMSLFPTTKDKNLGHMMRERNFIT